MGAFCSQLATADHSRGNCFHSTTTEVPEIDAHISEMAMQCEPVLYAAERPHWRKFCDYDYISEEGIRQSDFYRENLRFGISYRLALRLVDSPGVSKAMLWFWSPEAGHPQQAEFDLLDRIEGSLRLAAQVADAMGDSFEQETRVTDALEVAGSPALIIEPDGLIRSANTRARAILEGDDGLGCRAGRLTAGNPACSVQLKAVMAGAARALTSLRKAGGGGTVAVRRPFGRAPYTVTVAPLALKHHFLGYARPLLLAILNDPIAQKRTTRRVLQAAFFLTDAEAAVADLFAQGVSLKGIADQRGVSTETVRSQLKSIMSKTSTRRQVELMRVLSSFPRV